MAGRLRGVRWYGGKSPDGVIGPWIASLLPAPEVSQIYVEPFGGMLGVLMCRSPAGKEIINDLDHTVYEFWLALREQPDEVADLLAATPYCRQTYEDAQQVLRSEPGEHDAVRVCWAVATYYQMAFKSKGNYQTTAESLTGYGWHSGGSAANNGRQWLSTREMLTSLAMRQRLEAVIIDCRDAIDVLSLYADKPEAVIYLDPPYVDAYHPYQAAVDWTRLVEVCQSATARVAISDYDDHDLYDCLNWQRHDLPVWSSGASTLGGWRTECLWTNYDVAEVRPQQQLDLTPDTLTAGRDITEPYHEGSSLW